MSGVTRVVLGPRTRLGAELVARSAGTDLRLVARHADDAVALAERYRATGSVTVVDAADRDALTLLGSARGPVEVVICALGPSHPGATRTDADVVAVQRDRDLLAAVLDGAGDRTTSVVLVSTVVALAPADDRRYYGGWKNLVEAEVADVVARHAPRARLAVLYPGRLVTSEERPWHRLHAGYDRVVTRIERALAGRRTPRLVGADTRLWLLANGVRLALGLLRSPRADVALAPSTAPAPLEHRTVT